MIRTGLDRLLDEAHRLAGRPYGLLAHGASLTLGGEPAHLALSASAAGPPTALFGPEHGYYGVEQDMVASEHATDPWTGVPVLSLYGDDVGSLRPHPEAFDGLEVLLIDLQDVGSRYYTYAATAVWAAEVALAAGVEVWVLDRPNPLGGVVVEGGLVKEGFESFVGAFALPVRHGLTLAELVRLEGRRRSLDDAGLTLWTLEGWSRDMSWEACQRPWIQPSPNMPSLETARVYPGGCLLEATELSEGRGTTRPFELVGAPGIDPIALLRYLEERPVPGVRFVPTYFKPQFQKHAGAVCGGVQLVVTDFHRLPAYRCGIELLFALRRALGESFHWRQAPYEFVVDRPAIDLLTGDASCRPLVEVEDATGLDEWIGSWADEEQAFEGERREILLYGEGPSTVEIKS